ncbi:MAG: hypothetical protein QM499_01010 [Flavobacteriaceae bacterium]
MLKTIYLFIVIILGSISIASSQTTSLEELNKRILGDSITYSWDQANEFVNGLKNEMKLDSIYLALKRENLNLLKSYNSLELRLFNYKDTIVPAYKSLIKTKEDDIVDLNVLLKSSEKSFSKQRGKKWRWGTIALLGGTILGFILGGTI